MPSKTLHSIHDQQCIATSLQTLQNTFSIPTWNTSRHALVRMFSCARGVQQVAFGISPLPPHVTGGKQLRRSNASRLLHEPQPTSAYQGKATSWEESIAALPRRLGYRSPCTPHMGQFCPATVDCRGVQPFSLSPR
jgi:hypothetical protein